MNLTKKIWYIEIEGNREGPFSYLELEKDTRLTLETLVWREGFDKWLPISEVEELSGIFHDEEEVTQEYEPKTLTSEDDEIVLEYQKEPRNYFWLLLLLLTLSFILYQLFNY